MKAGLSEAAPVEPAVPGDLLRSTVRALELLRVIGSAPHPGLHIDDIARACGTVRGTAYHYSRTLLYCGYLQRRDPGTYTLGPAIFDRAQDLARQLTDAGQGCDVDDLAAAMDRPVSEVQRRLDQARRLWTPAGQVASRP